MVSLRVLSVVAALIWALWISLGGILSFPASQPVPAEVIVVLGEDPGHRYQKAKSLISAGFAPQLILILPLPPVAQDAKARFGDDKVIVETQPDSTWSEAVVMRERLAALGVRKVLVVSDPPHLLRAAYSWGSVFRGAEIEYHFVATEPDWWSDWNWWENEQGAIYAGMELLKLLYYFAKYRFNLF